MSKFIVGDLVIGNELADMRYGVTVQGYIARVLATSINDSIVIQGVDDGDDYTVSDSCFDLYAPLNPSKGEEACLDSLFGEFG